MLFFNYYFENMSFLEQLPKITCHIEKKDFILSLDSKTNFIHMWLTEVCQHKSFSIDITPDTLEWVRKCFKALLDTSTSKHFFTERRQEDNCMCGWERQRIYYKSKTNITVEIFRIDNKGRKCSILVLEDLDKFGWKSFLALITFRHDTP